MFLKKYFGHTKKEKQLCIIGVAGLESGCGATHFTFCAANYLSNVRRKKVAVFNMSSKQDYRQAKIILNNKDDNDETCYDFAGITFFAEACENMIAGCEKEYDYLILDLGSRFNEYKKILLRCNVRIIIGAFNQWRIKSFVLAVSELKDLLKCNVLECICTFYSKKGLKVYKDLVSKEVKLMPFEPDPFKIHKDMIAFMDGVFKNATD